MRKLFLPLLLISASLASQNLVINPGFEEHSANSSYNYDDDFRSSGVTGWYNPTRGTSDFEDGASNSHSGDCSAGGYVVDLIYTNGAEYREYVGGTLTDSLVGGTEYRFSMAVKAGSSNGTVHELGVYFTSQTYHNGTEFGIKATPQIVLTDADASGVRDWIILKGTFVAAGGEKYFVIGNFNDNSHSDLQGSSGVDAAYYYFDDLCLKGSSEPVSSDENQNGAVNANTNNNNQVNAWVAPNLDGSDNNQYHSNNSQHSNVYTTNSDSEIYTHYGDTISEKADHHPAHMSQNQHSNQYHSNNYYNNNQYQSYNDAVDVYDPYTDSLNAASQISSDPMLDDSVVVDLGYHVEANTILFDFDETTLMTGYDVKLDQLVRALKDNPWVNVELDGFSEDIQYRSAHRLSKGRVETIATYLTDHGIDSKRIKKVPKETYKGSGDGKRVEFIFTERKL